MTTYPNKKKPTMKAVPLYSKVMPPHVKYCPKLITLKKGWKKKKRVVCGVQLQYWQSKGGYVWVCPRCLKVVEVAK